MEKQIKKIIVTWAPPIYHYYYMFCPRVFMCFTPGQGCKLETRTHDHEFGFWSLYPLGHHGEWQKITFGRGIYVFFVCECMCMCAYKRVRVLLHMLVHNERACVSSCAFAYTSAFKCVCVCVFVCALASAYTCTHRSSCADVHVSVRIHVRVREEAFKEEGGARA